MTSANAFSKQTISGVTYKAGVQSAGFPMLRAQLPAGADWSTNKLNADQTALPSPAQDEDYTTMNRVWSYQTLSVADSCKNLLFTLYVPASSIQPRGTIATIYFVGPPSFDQQAATYGPLNPNVPNHFAGTGYYALKIRGDGKAYLYELMVSVGPGHPPDWRLQYSFIWNEGISGTPWVCLNLSIVNDVFQDNNGNYNGSYISFSHKATGNSPGKYNKAQFYSQISSVYERLEKGNAPTYKVPQLLPQKIQKNDLRVDIAVDNRASFNVSNFAYQPTGYLQDDPVTFNQPLVAGQFLTLYFTGVLPPGCTWTGSIIDQNGVALTPATAQHNVTNVNGQKTWQSFYATAKMTAAIVKISFTADASNTYTPILKRWNLLQNSVLSTVNATPFTVPPLPPDPSLPPQPQLWTQVIESVQITSEGTDIENDNATVKIMDFTGDLDFLEQVNLVPVHIWMTDTNLTTNPTGKPISLFRGYCLNAVGKRMRTFKGQVYPNKLWTEWTLQCVGEWSRVMDAKLPKKMSWGDTDTGTTAKVTDAIATLLNMIYDPSMIAVPDQPIRLFGANQNHILQFPGTQIADLCKLWMKQYLGGYILFDPAAGPNGMYRAMLQKVPPYNNLAVFEMDHPSVLAQDGKIRLPQFAGSYPILSASDGIPAAAGQQVQSTFMQAGTYVVNLKRAESNAVVVIGGGPNEESQASNSSDITNFTAVALNVKSANFFNLSSDNPNYPQPNTLSFLGRIVPTYFIDYTLPNQQAVDFVCRRIYDKACFARYTISFEAPLITVFDVTDPFQTRPRPLRYYDPVMVRQYDGSLKQFLILSCVPEYTKDTIQMARYVLVTQENINQRAIAEFNGNEFGLLKGAFERLYGISYKEIGSYFASNAHGATNASEFIVTPNPTSLPLQQLDPTKANFGAFYYMPEYSTVNGGDIIR
jgi:hypothetical protein